MRSTAFAETPPGIQPVRISFQDVRVGEMKMPHRLHFTVEATRPWNYEEASISMAHSVTFHGPEEQARQQRTPVGAHKTGTVHIIAKGRALSPAEHDTSAISSSDIDSGSSAPVLSVPLYAACASYQRPNPYKEHPNLCIVENPQYPSAPFRPPHHSGARRQNRRGALEGPSEKPIRIMFIDVAALTPDPRASLRCTSTGEISIPTTLYFRCASASSSSSQTSALAKDHRRLQGRYIPWHGARDGSQQRRRRVVLLPPTAAGKVFELVSISMKRGREE
ncbi:hypothetical protein LSCM4_03638 [Leishmania orientalis]|uniref:Uncharacterized protein n=1 Tax=Leishmania orientalis TaxID=2249476 RepID=A0A836KES7_9TRYP|nr:hypothetical protein LSCM4_03638 [Leishmania orientalis]